MGRHVVSAELDHRRAAVRQVRRQLGRKVVLQASIVIFLAGSILCGVAQNMTQLIALRALQGLGDGGLMVVTMAGIADVIPRPRNAAAFRACSARLRSGDGRWSAAGRLSRRASFVALDLLYQRAARRARARRDPVRVQAAYGARRSSR